MSDIKVRKLAKKYLTDLVVLNSSFSSARIIRESDYAFVLLIKGVRIRVNVQVEAELGNRKPKSVAAK